MAIDQNGQKDQKDQNAKLPKWPKLQSLSKVPKLFLNMSNKLQFVPKLKILQDMGQFRQEPQHCATIWKIGKFNSTLKRKERRKRLKNSFILGLFQFSSTSSLNQPHFDLVIWFTKRRPQAWPQKYARPPFEPRTSRSLQGLAGNCEAVTNGKSV